MNAHWRQGYKNRNQAPECIHFSIVLVPAVMEANPTEIEIFAAKREILSTYFHTAMLNTLLLGMLNLSIF